MRRKRSKNPHAGMFRFKAKPQSHPIDMNEYFCANAKLTDRVQKVIPRVAQQILSMDKTSVSSGKVPIAFMIEDHGDVGDNCLVKIDGLPIRDLLKAHPLINTAPKCIRKQAAELFAMVKSPKPEHSLPIFRRFENWFKSNYLTASNTPVETQFIQRLLLIALSPLVNSTQK